MVSYRTQGDWVSVCDASDTARTINKSVIVIYLNKQIYYMYDSTYGRKHDMMIVCPLCVALRG